MATLTPNYNLSKPDASDQFDAFRQSYNDNMDIIDNNLGGGGGGDTVTWTQIQQSGTKIAEIDINGTPQDVYAPSGGGGASVNYSTTEQVIGTWIDGKTVYQRVFDFGSDIVIGNTAFTNTSIDASNMQTLIYALGIYSTGATIYNLMPNINNSVIRLQSDRNNGSANVRYLILRYTKITD